MTGTHAVPDHGPACPAGRAAAAILLCALILACGCTGGDPVQAGPATPGAPAAAVPAVLPQDTRAAGTPATAVTPSPAARDATAPSCSDLPLNPWTSVPESYRPAAGLPPGPGTLVSWADLAGTPSLRWRAYTGTDRFLNPASGEILGSAITWREEVSPDTCNGKPALHRNDTLAIRATRPVPSAEQVTVRETWYNAGGIPVKQHRTVSIAGTVYEDADLPPGDPGTGCSPDLSKPLYRYEGTGPVTVPAGTFPDARQYTKTDSSGKTVTFWFAPGIPVEIRKEIRDPATGGEYTAGLTGWG